MRRVIVCLICCFAAGSSVQADVLTNVTAWSVNFWPGNATFDPRPPQNAVDGSGLTGDAHVKHPNFMWMEFAPTGFAYITFDDWYAIDQIEVWNYNENNDPEPPPGPWVVNGARDVDLEFWTGTDWETVEVTGLTIAPGVDGYNTPDVIDLSGDPVTARDLRFHIRKNQGGIYCGVSEIRFSGTSASGPSFDESNPLFDPNNLIVVTTENPVGFGARVPENTINGSGMTGNTHDTNESNMWQQSEVAGWIQYDLGDFKNFDGMKIWNYNEHVVGAPHVHTGGGANSVDILVSNDSVNWTMVYEGFGLPEAPGVSRPYDDPALVDLAGASGRYLRIDIVDVLRESGIRSGLSEVRFYGTPSTGVTARSADPVVSANQVVNGNGLADSLEHGTDPATMWQENSPIGVMTIDLGNWRDLTQLDIWNYNEPGETDQGAKTIQIEYWTGTTWATAIASATLTEAPGTAGYNTPDVIPVSFTGRVIRLIVTENHGDPSFCGLSEIVFTGTDGTPPAPAVFDKTNRVFSAAITASSANPVAGQEPIKTVDSSGMTGNAHDATAVNMWKEVGSTGWVAYEFSGATELTGMEVWNYNETGATHVGAKLVDIETSTDGIVWTPIMSNYGLLEALGQTGYQLDLASIDLGGLVTQYIRINITENFSSASNCGLSEVRFYSPSTGIQATSHLPSSEDTKAIKAVSGTGLGGNVHISDPESMWLENGATGAMTVDLGDWYALTQLEVWNYNAAGETDRGGQTIDIEAWNGSTWTELSGIGLTQAPGTNSYSTPNVIPVSLTAQIVRIIITQNYGDASNCGLSEVRFTGAVTADPTPPVDSVNILFTSTGIGVSSEVTGHAATKTTNGSGIDLGDYYTRTHDNLGTNMWLANGATASIAYVFNEGAVPLSSVRVWNYNESGATAKGVKLADIQVTDNPVNGWTTAIAQQGFLEAPGETGYLPQIIDLTGITTKYIRFTITENFGDPDNVGLSEVLFFTPSTGITATSNDPWNNRIPNNAVSGSGLKDPNMLNLNGNLHGSQVEQMWMNWGTTGSLMVDLGKRREITKIEVWNYNEAGAGANQFIDRGVKKMDIDSWNGTAWAPELTNVNLDKAFGSPNYEIDPDNIIDTSSDPIVTQRLRFVITENWGDPDFCGLSEIRFTGPEVTAELINLPEYAIFALRWLDTPCNDLNNWCDFADLDQNGEVNIVDLEIWLTYWLTEY